MENIKTIIILLKEVQKLLRKAEHELQTPAEIEIIQNIRQMNADHLAELQTQFPETCAK